MPQDVTIYFFVLMRKNLFSISHFLKLVDCFHRTNLLNKRFFMAKTELSHISYQLGPCSTVKQSINQSSFFETCFHESVNERIQKCQKDFAIRYQGKSQYEVVVWCTSGKLDCQTYISSCSSTSVLYRNEKFGNEKYDTADGWFQC